MADIRLSGFVAKTTPVGADIIYVGDSAASFTESKSTVTQIGTTILTLGLPATLTGTVNINTSGSAVTTIGSGSSNIRGNIWVDTGFSPNNVALTQIPYGSLTSGANNTAIGNEVLSFVTSGSNNTGLGNTAMHIVSTGQGNTAVGASSGATITTGFNNTCIGVSADVNNANAQNRISLGTGASVQNDNQCCIGNNGLLSIVSGSTAGGCAIGTTAFPFGSLVLGSSSTSNVTLSPASQAAARTYTIGDAGGAAQFIMSAYGSAQTVSSIVDFTNATSASSTSTGAIVTTGGIGCGDNIWYAGALNATASSNQIIFRTTNATTITAPNPAGSRTYTIPDAGQNANFQMQSTQSVTGTATLSNSSYGQTIVCTGSSAYTVTLPAVSAGKFLYFVFNTTSNALVTLSPASGNISGQASVIYGSFEGCTLYSDGTNWIIINQQLQPVSFNVSLNSAQFTVTTGFTIVTYDTTNFDIGSFWNGSTHIYTPLYPGKYKFSTEAYFINSTNAQAPATLQLRKNGPGLATFQQSVVASATATLGCNNIASLNGSTDTVSVFAEGSASGGVLNNSAAQTFLTGHRISNF